MEEKLSVVIMAAGFGTRMKSKVPKVLHELSGVPMLYHIIKEALKLSDDIHVVLFHEYEKIQEAMSEHFEDINYHIQDHKNYPGTGGAIMGIEPKNEKILVLSGDMPLVTQEDLSLLVGLKADVVMSVFKTQSIGGYGRVVMDEGLHVRKIVEEKDANEEERKINIANGGVYLFSKSFLTKMLPKLSNNNAQKEYYITDLVSLANKNSYEVKAVFVDEMRFMGVNSKAHLAKAETFMQNAIKTKWMEEGVLMRLPETIYIDVRTTMKGECVIENGVSILGNCTIENSSIKTNSVIEQSIIKNSSVGPLARVRPQSYIEDTHIGNFVEVKKSTLKGVKAGHLSYLGDAFIDEGTNVGCGTITCNYDGVQKYQTIIGKNVFIGSDTQLIAPVKVEDDVLIAAGTTVTKDVKKGSLAISRVPLKFVDGFYEKFFNKEKKNVKK